ncbi:MAG: acyltransferase [Propionibacteriaceae bacterium]|nr:acyltransferase [Propionibacteriaceae bacterium]
MRRNHLIDLARVLSMAIVVSFHALLYYIVLDNGRVEVLPYGPGPWLWVLSWVLCLLPLFFVAAGYGAAATMERNAALGVSYPEYLLSRLRKLLGPLTSFCIVFVLASTIPAWFGAFEPAMELSKRFAQLLWFLVVYLGLQAAAPALARLEDSHCLIAMLAMVLATAAVDAAAQVSGYQELHWLNLATVWPLAFQFGIAYRRGWFVRLRRWKLALMALAMWALICWMVLGLGYPASSVGFADMLVANVQPPTLAAVWMTAAQVCLLAIGDRSKLFRSPSESAQRVLGVLNALVLPSYLWHIAAIVIAGALLVGLTMLFPVLAPVTLSSLALVVCTWAVLSCIIGPIARVDQRLIPPAPARMPTLGPTLVGFGLLVTGLWSVWQFGAVLHPGAPLACVSVALLATAIIGIRRIGR